MNDKEFTPALGYSILTPLYDLAIALLTRELVWRSALAVQVDPMSNDHILDVGCGTGAMAIRLKSIAPGARIIGLDPDPGVLLRARNKAARTGTEVNWKQGFLTSDITAEIGPVSKIVSSLVFHQTALDEKSNILSTMREILEPGGSLHIADYGLQRTPLMRALFRQIQQLDGYANTTPNAEGVLPELMREVGFSEIRETSVIATPTGSISLYAAVNGARA